MEWPPQSPGLNNTETVWDYLDASMVAQLLTNFCLTAREHWFQTCKGTCSMEFDCFLHAHTQVSPAVKKVCKVNAALGLGLVLPSRFVVSRDLFNG